MKYSKRLANELQAYPQYIRERCLSYKTWKKDIKRYPYCIYGCWKNKLLRECKKLDAFLFPPYETLDPKMVYEMCKINLNTLYKICKRLDKKLGVKAYNYYCMLLDNNNFRFTYLSHETLVL
jgi:hypothetical protein